MTENKKLKIVLAYSGGLDTSTIVPWLKENYDCEVHAVCVNVGQGDNEEEVVSRGLRIGATTVEYVNVQDEFVKDYVYPMLKSGAMYEGKYLLGTSIARPLIAKVLVEKAKALGADAICHGATGKGNDQVRFELTIMALAPEMKIIAPWRIWDIKSRQDALDYCAARGIDLPMSADTSYSRDENMWHLSHEGLELEDPANAPNYEKLLQNTTPLEKTPDEGEFVEIEFVKGIPVKVNGKEMAPAEMIFYLNEIGGKHGVGVIDMVENRVVGMKSRGVYETPAGTILYFAHNELEELCLDREMSALKREISLKYANMVYEGKWFSRTREALDAFVDATQETVTGTVKMKLYKGHIINYGKTSPYSLYNQEISSFETGELYDHKDSEGFIKLYGLPLKINAMMKANNACKCECDK